MLPRSHLCSLPTQAAAHRGFSTRDWTNGALVPEPEAPLYIILWLSTFRTPVLDELFLFDMRNVSFYIPTLLRSVTQGRVRSCHGSASAHFETMTHPPLVSDCHNALFYPSVSSVGSESDHRKQLAKWLHRSSEL